MKVALISGTSINRSDVFADWETQIVETKFGNVSLKSKGNMVGMNRHGFESALPPHAINYRANIDALCILNVESAITLSSVGSVDENLPPSSLVSCDDYMSFAPKTFIDDRMSAFGPEITNPLLKKIIEVSPVKIELGKVYFQTPGPRFETKAEVRAIRAMGADIVGMTLANEADLLLEREIPITAFGMIDNFAHGVGGQTLSNQEFLKLVKVNQLKVNDFVQAVVNAFV